jgi:hypothetical protein
MNITKGRLSFNCNLRSHKYSTKAHRSKSVAVVLSGSGVFDGSEIHESVAILLSCAQAGAKVSCFAPNVQQVVQFFFLFN